jgi:glycosyltransferase involved in cell wall biosynthesis
MSSVFASQVARPMSLVQEHGHPVTLAVFSPLGEYVRRGPRQRWQQRRKWIERDFGVKIQPLPSPPSRARRLWSDAAVLGRWLRRRSCTVPVILHCRGPVATQIALAAVGKDPHHRVVFDCRGLDAAEFLYVRGYRSPNEAPKHIRDAAQTFQQEICVAALRSDAVICVSEALRREVVETWSVPRAKTRVIPCCTDLKAGTKAATHRDETRQRLALEDRFVVAYCGSSAAWQVATESLAVFNLIASLEPRAHFLAIATQPARIEEAAEHAGVPAARRTIVSVPHTEVADYLAAADLGLLIRESSPVNRVASPVKFAEYLSCGVPVVVSEGVGDYAELVGRRGLGCVVAGFADRGSADTLAGFLEQYRRSPHGLRERCLAAAREGFGWDSAISTLCALYAELTEDRAPGEDRPALLAGQRLVGSP